MDVDPAGRLCALALLAGREEVCPGEACPLWEDGGCVLERLTAEGEVTPTRGPTTIRPLQAKSNR